MRNRVCYKNCIHYGTQFDRRIERDEEREEDRRYTYPLYMRLRRHVGRRYW